MITPAAARALMANRPAATWTPTPFSPSPCSLDLPDPEDPSRCFYCGDPVDHNTKD